MTRQKINAFIFALGFLGFYACRVTALDSVVLDIAEFNAGAWRLNQLHVTLNGLGETAPNLNARIGQLQLPPPFDKLQLVALNCQRFTFHSEQVRCQQGTGLLNQQKLTFSFRLSPSSSHLDLTLHTEQNRPLRLQITTQDLYWTADLTAEQADLTLLAPLISQLSDSAIKLESGLMTGDLHLSGIDLEPQELSFQSEFNQLSLQTDDGKVAVQNLDADWQGTVHDLSHQTVWESALNLYRGEVYIEPIYKKLNQTPMHFTADGAGLNELRINRLNLQEPEIWNVNLTGPLTWPQNESQSIKVLIQADDLLSVSQTYLNPFFEQTALEGIHFSGHLQASINIENGQVSRCQIGFNKTGIEDTEQRIRVHELDGTLNWSEQETQQSALQWQQLQIFALPFDAAGLEFSTQGAEIELLKPAKIPVLQGHLDIDQFKWVKQADQEPEVFFKGQLQDVSMPLLSAAHQWPLMRGTLSGQIPGVRYQNRFLSLDGELNFAVFDGQITIKNLSSSGLLTHFARLYLDMSIDNLDLYELTEKFQFGSIQGRLSGFINDLYLENWQPVQFYAWLGTPDDDSSKHRISQRAVENIASIGGGGAADVLSKGFLSFFDDFGYDKLGFGCYLNQGVCQLMGVEASDNGYYLIKGGGIPRIDVIAYHPRVDWSVLLQRLARITTTDSAIVK